MTKATSVSDTTTLAARIGKNVTRMREQRELSVTAFAGLMNTALGKGWQRQEVYKYERGDKSMSSEELIAAALVLDCTVGDLTAGLEPVLVGASTVSAQEIDESLNRASVEAEGWQSFLEAGEALNDLRHAASRYVNAIGRVRSRVAESPALRRRIQRFGQESTSHLEQQLAAFSDADDAPVTADTVQENATPAIVAADDALHTERGVLWLTWLWRKREPRGAN